MNTTDRKRSRFENDSALVSLVDVVFVLVFGLATLVSNKVPTTVDMATTNSAARSASKNRDSTLPVLEITHEAALRLNGETIERQSLVPMLTHLLATQPKKAVLVQPDGKLAIQHLLVVTDLLESAHLNPITQAQRISQEP
ncbi:MAG: biopolymer transporter ExbD [Planctomycetia bacterium]|nr:biopolymer transporter ExbD [Planctomycetia bacterium]